MWTPAEGKQKFSWSKASIVATSMTLGFLLLFELRGIGNSKESIDGLLGALRIVAFPGALVLVILAPYMVVRSGEEWVDKRQSEASFLAESAQTPRLSLLRGSETYEIPNELLRSPMETGDRDPQQLLRVRQDSVTDSERG